MAGKEYEYFIAIAEQKSLLQASDQLYITPSGLSKYVQRLENDLGLRLFDKVGKKYILTYAGQRYYEWCLKIRADEAGCADEMQYLAQSGKKVLRIGFPVMRARFFTSIVIPQFRQRYPNVDLIINERNGPQIWPMFLSHALDLIFMYRNPASVSDSIQNELISYENMVLCVSKNHRLRTPAIYKEGFPYPWVDLAALSDEDLIVITDSVQETMGSIEIIFSRYIQSPRIVMRTMTSESIAMAISQNVGISILSDKLIHYFGCSDKIDCYSFGEKPLVSQHHAFYHSSPSISEEIASMIRIVRENDASYSGTV